MKIMAWLLLGYVVSVVEAQAPIVYVYELTVVSAGPRPVYATLKEAQDAFKAAFPKAEFIQTSSITWAAKEPYQCGTIITAVKK